MEAEQTLFAPLFLYRRKTHSGEIHQIRHWPTKPAITQQPKRIH